VILDHCFRSGDSPRVRGESKNAGAEDSVEAVRHFAVVASFIVKSGAFRGDSPSLTVVPTVEVENAQVQSTHSARVFYPPRLVPYL